MPATVFSLTSLFGMHRHRYIYEGEFAVAGGAITAGSVKFKKNVTVSRTSAGLYLFSIWQDTANTIPLKGMYLKWVDVTLNTPAQTTDGGWGWFLDANNVNSAGTFQLRFVSQTFAAADLAQTPLVAFVLTPSPNS